MVRNESRSLTARERVDLELRHLENNRNPLGIPIEPFSHSKSSVAFGRKAILPSSKVLPRNPDPTSEEFNRNHLIYSDRKKLNIDFGIQEEEEGEEERHSKQ